MKLDPLNQSTRGFCASEGRHLELAITLVKATLDLRILHPRPFGIGDYMYVETYTTTTCYETYALGVWRGVFSLFFDSELIPNYRKY
eukprot:5180897-Pleurochrysis_carterae.AAC.1